MSKIEKQRRQVVVAIDGPAGAGKSTVTKALTSELGYQLLDTGALYRSVAYRAWLLGVDWGDSTKLAQIAQQLDIRFALEGDINRVFLAGTEVSEEIRRPEISEGASQVSALPAVRTALLELQREMGGHGGVIAEGRDVGTVVFPAAEAKFFLTASIAERARRRVTELIKRGHDADFNDTLAEIERRDARDSNRKVAPLCQADDARLIDSTGRTIAEVVAEMAMIVRAAEELAATDS